MITTDTGLYLLVLLATMLLGIGEVLYDNSAQTFMPSIVHPDNLEKANGRLWSIEQVANTFAGPPLAALLIAIAFSLPFYVDAATFAVSAALIAWIRRPGPTPEQIAERRADRRPWKTELAEGFRWLWSHDLLRTLAIVLGLLNMLGTLSTATFVLYGQEVLGTTATEFALLGTGGAVGGHRRRLDRVEHRQADRRRPVARDDTARRWRPHDRHRAHELVAGGVADARRLHVRRRCCGT